MQQGSGAWAGPIGDADSRGDWPSGARAQDAQPPGRASGDPDEPIKVAVMDTRSGRSGGHDLKGPPECATFYSMRCAVIQASKAS
jgi:hypothetical protein